jgi:two-component system, LytTR family, response regulator LytT
MKIIIIEDEAPALRRLEKLLRDIEPGIEVLQNFDSISGAVAYLQTKPAIDLIFSDIQLADGLSFEIFQQVPTEVPVIFTTAYDEYAIRAFKVNSIDYLLKPIEKEALQASINKYINLQKGNQVPDLQPILGQLLQQVQQAKTVYRQGFLVNYRDKFQRIDISEIAYFYSEAKLTHIVTHEGRKYPTPETLEELEANLDPQVFYRANRQFLISMQAVSLIASHLGGKLKLSLNPHTPEEVFVSREKATSFKEWMNQ